MWNASLARRKLFSAPVLREGRSKSIVGHARQLPALSLTRERVARPVPERSLSLSKGAEGLAVTGEGDLHPT